NNDTVVGTQALRHLIDRMEEDPDIGICGSKLIYYHDQDTLQALGGGFFNKWFGTVTTIGGQESIDMTFSRDEIESRLDYIVGASMMVSEILVNKIGLLNEEYFLYYEEIDWAMRSKEEFNLGFAPQSVVYHKEGASTGG